MRVGTGLRWGMKTQPVPQPHEKPRFYPRVSATRAESYVGADESFLLYMISL